MFGRLAPGDGEFPLVELVSALPPHLDIGLEIPNVAAALVAGSPSDVAARSVAAARALGV